ncbi:MAG: hypothetical protein N3F63_05655 [Thermoplasmata archaeon]|nr:hypothetical protein [Thermoplasmata archaeon]
MASPWKIYQYQKQIQEKAKEAEETKKSAKANLDRCKEILDGIKKLNVDMGEVEKLFAEANSAYDKSDFQKSNELCKSIEEKAKTIMERYCADITELISKLIKNLAETDEMRSNEIPRQLEQVKSFLEKGEGPSAARTLSEINAQFEKNLETVFKKLFSIGDNLIGQSRKMGENITYPENLFTQAKQLYSQKKYDEAILKLNESLDILSIGVKSKISDEISALRTSVEGASALGMNVSEFLPLIEKAEKELKAYRFEEAMGLTTHLRSRMGELLSKTGESILSNVRRFIARAEKIAPEEEDFLKAKSLVPNVEELIKKGDIKGAGEIAKQIKELSENAQFQLVLKTIAASRSKFITAKKIGADISQPLGLINSARAALKNAEYEKALKYAVDADTEVDKIIKEYEASAMEIENLEASLNALATFGIEVPEARKAVEEARRALEEKNYKKVHEIVENAKVIAENAAYDRILELVEQLTADMEYAKSIGCSIQKYEAKHEELLAMVKARKIVESIQNLKILREDVSTVIQDFVIDTVAQVKELIEKSVGVDTTFARQRIVDAENALQSGDVRSAYQYAEEAKKSIKEFFSAQAGKSLEEMGKLLESLKNLKVDVTSSSELYEKARECYEKGDYPKCLSHLDEIRSKLNRLLISKTEEEFTAAKLVLIEAKKSGIDISNLKNLLMEAKTEIEGGNYLKGYELAFKCHTEAERLKKLSQQAFDEISTAATMVAEAKKSNADISKVKDLLLKAKVAFENNDYETALEYAKHTKEEAAKLTSQYHSAKIILEVADKITIAEQFGIVTAKIREMLEEAKGYMKNKDYDRSLDLAKTCNDEISTLLRDHITLKISEIENLIRNARDLNVHVPKAEELIREARISFEKGDYVNSLRYATESRDELEKVVAASQNAAMEIKKAHEKINEAESLRIDVAASKNLLSQAMNALKTSNYKMAQDIAAKCMADVDAAIVRHIEKLINSFQTVITNAKRSGAITVIAENMIAQAKVALSQRNYKEALNLAMRSEGELERAELQYSMASSAIATAQSKMEEAKRSGTMIPSNIEENLRNAKTALARGDYIKAMELAVATSDMIAEVKEKMREINEIIQIARTRITEAYKYGAELTEAKEIFAQAKAALESGKYAEALQLAKRCIEESKNTFRNYLTSQLASIENLVVVGNDLKLDTSRLSALITQARSAIETGEFEKVPEFINKAKDYGEKMIIDTMQRLTNQLQRTIEQAAELIDVTEYSQALERCKAKIGERAYDTAYKQLTETIDKIQAEYHKAISEKISLFESQIISAEKVGIDTTTSMEALTQAKIALNSKAYDGLNTFLNNAMQELYENVKTKLSSVIYQVEVKLNYAKNMGVLVTEAETVLKKARESYAQGNMPEAISQIQQCDVAIEMAKDMHRELTDLLYTADSAIANARKYGLDTKESEDTLKEALYEKTRDYRKAIELTRKSIEIAKKLVDAYEEEKARKEMAERESKKELVEKEERAEKKPKIIVPGMEKEEVAAPVPQPTPGVEKPAAPPVPEVKEEAKAETKVEEKPQEAAPEVKMEFEKGVASGNEKCNFCKGKIKAGLAIIKCKCGAVYHEPCAKRTGKCNACGTSLEEKVVAKKLPALKL